ncbi:MAG: hypothetical protein PHQ52_04245 [Candidatus Omnitrophica bacterium]|nr:hypothetical protein [Candidatus Omnitrophota bacterium]
MSIITEALKKAQHSKERSSTDISFEHFAPKDYSKNLKKTNYLGFLKYLVFFIFFVFLTVCATLSINYYVPNLTNISLQKAPDIVINPKADLLPQTNVTIKNSNANTPVIIDTPNSGQITGIKPKSSIAYKNNNIDQGIRSIFRKKHNLSLRGIMSSGDAPVAVINERVVRVGDSIDDAKILEISSENVKIDYNGYTETLQLEK